MGQAVGDNWLGAASEAGGTPIPAPIADKLRGQDFRNFDEFREKFWSAVSNDAELSKKLGPLNKAITKNGYSPYAPRSEQVGGREKLEIHHVHPISKGGEVYNIDNMAITTPKAHISEHSNNNGVPQ
ncbi:Colicin-E9 [compost metagenome]